MVTARLQRLESSGIRKIFDRARVIERERPVAHLEIGRPMFEPPAFATEAMIASVRANEVYYVANKGPMDTRAAVADFLHRRNGFEINPENEMILTAGASEAVACSMLAFVEAGDEILVPTPAWPHYRSTALLAGANVREVPLRASMGFGFDMDDLERAVCPQTKLLVFNNPSNPTGAYHDVAVQRDILAFAQRHGLIVLVDEIYDNYVYGAPFHSMMRLDGAAQQCVYISGASKNFGITGLRLGVLAATADRIESLNKVHQYLTVCASSLSLGTWRRILSNRACETFLDEMHVDYHQRHALTSDVLRTNRNLVVGNPGGAFYFFVEYPAACGDSVEVAGGLLEDRGVATVPGSVFGQDFHHALRIAYTADRESLLWGLRAVSDFFAQGASHGCT